MSVMSKKETRQRGAKKQSEEARRKNNTKEEQQLLQFSQYLMIAREHSFAALAAAADECNVSLDTSDRHVWERLKKKALRRKRRKNSNESETRSNTPVQVDVFLEQPVEVTLQVLFDLVLQYQKEAAASQKYIPEPVEHTLAQLSPRDFGVFFTAVDDFMKSCTDKILLQKYEKILTFIYTLQASYKSRWRNETHPQEWSLEDWEAEVSQLRAAGEKHTFDFLRPRMKSLLTQVSPETQEKIKVHLNL